MAIHRASSIMQLRGKRIMPTRLICVGEPKDTAEIRNRLETWYLDRDVQARVRISAETELRLRTIFQRHAMVLITSTSKLGWRALLGVTMNRIRIADEIRFSSASAIQMARLGQYDLKTPHVRAAFLNVEHRRAGELTSLLGRVRFSQIFGTGPTLETVTRADIRSDALRIACNSAIANPSVLRTIAPHGVVFGDPAFHFGPSDYSCEFRQELWSWLSCDARRWALVPREFAHLLLSEPGSQQVFSARLTPFWKLWPLPSSLAHRFPRTGNILTQFLLPVAACHSDVVEIFGCDGRDATDVGFWPLASSRLSAHYESVRCRHPGFFGGVSYQNYYDLHCRRLEDTIRRLTRRGAVIYARTDSLIPALDRRRSAPLARGRG